MDPQQRLLLHVAYEALENAGYVPDATPSFQKDKFGCFVGAATKDYAENLRNDIDVYYSTGSSGCLIVIYEQFHLFSFRYLGSIP